MDYESLKTPADDVVRDGASFEAYRLPGDLIDSQHPIIVAYARRVAGDGSDQEKALRLYYAVREAVRYNPYTFSRDPQTLKASHGVEVAKKTIEESVRRSAMTSAPSRSRTF